jgi:hypothetical protein
VLSYVRNEWGNKAPPVKPQEVKAIRDETKSHAGTAYSPEELLKLPDSN